MSAKAVRMDDRAVIAVSGEEARHFLQNILTNDIGKATSDRAIYAALLTPQGKYLFDFLIIETGGALLFDCEAARKQDLLRRLTMYRLRAKAEIADVSDKYAVWAIFGEDEAGGDLAALTEAGSAGAYAGGVAFRDPRLLELGWRAILPAGTQPGLPEPGRAAYEAHRLTLGVPDGSRDLEVDRTLALEGDIDLLGGIDFEKGCYVGQEITARMKHRGKVRKRLLPVRAAAGLLAPGTDITCGGKSVGRIRSAEGEQAMALLRLDSLDTEELAAGKTPLSVVRPPWLEAT